jgi:hypothetical protein
MSVEPAAGFDPEQNRTIARIKADLAKTKPELLAGLGGVPAATPEQMARWDREVREPTSPEYPRRLELRVDHEWQREEHKGRRRERENGHLLSRPTYRDVGRDTPERVFEARAFDTRQFKPVEFAWEARLVRGVPNLIAGEEGIGTGTLEAWLIAQLTKGELPGDFEGVPARVLWIGDEDDCHHVVGPRLYAAGADFTRICEVTSIENLLLNVATDGEQLGWLIETENVDVVVFEALLDNLPPLRNPNDPQDVRPHYSRCEACSPATTSSASAPLHTIKGQASDFRQKMAGSHQYNALSRSSMLVAWHPDGSGRRVLLGGKANYSAAATPLSFAVEAREFDLNGHHFEVPLACEFEEEPDLTMEAVLRGPARERERERDERREAILDVLTGTPQTVRAIAEETGIPKSSVQRYLDDLGGAGFGAQERRRVGRVPVPNPYRWDGTRSAPGGRARGGRMTGAQERSRG